MVTGVARGGGGRKAAYSGVTDETICTTAFRGAAAHV